MTLEQFILDHIGKHRSVTFGQLKQAGSEAGYAMDGDLELGADSDYLWCGMSREFAEAVWNLIDRQEVRIIPTTQLDILVSNPTIMVSEQLPIPCRLEAT